MANQRAEDDQVPLLAEFPSPGLVAGDGPGGHTGPYCKKQILAALVVCLSPFTMGMVLGYSSPTTPELLAANILKTTEAGSWFGSLVTVGAMLGGPLAGPLVAQLGRKITLMLTCVPYVIGWAMLAYGGDVGLLYSGRAITGLGAGMTCICANMYISEVTSKELRGAMSGCFQLSVTLGVLLTFVLGNYLSWQWLAVTGLVPPVLLIFAMILIPETPHWYLSKQQRNNAIDTLVWLRGPGVNVEVECSEIEENIELQQQEKLRLSDILKPGLYRPLLVCLGLMLFQQFSGINAVLFYLVTIFQSAGYKGNKALPTILMGVVQVVSTGIACVLMDRAGRRVLLLVSGVLMSLSAGTLGLYYYLTSHNISHNIGWLSLASLCIYIFAFSIGTGPVPWVVMGEIFPSKARGISSSIATLVNWTCAFFSYQRISFSCRDFEPFWGLLAVCRCMSFECYFRSYLFTGNKRQISGTNRTIFRCFKKY